MSRETENYVYDIDMFENITVLGRRLMRERFAASTVYFGLSRFIYQTQSRHRRKPCDILAARYLG